MLMFFMGLLYSLLRKPLNQKSKKSLIAPLFDIWDLTSPLLYRQFSQANYETLKQIKQQLKTDVDKAVGLHFKIERIGIRNTGIINRKTNIGMWICQNGKAQLTH